MIKHNTAIPDEAMRDKDTYLWGCPEENGMYPLFINEFIGDSRTAKDLIERLNSLVKFIKNKYIKNKTWPLKVKERPSPSQ